MNEDRAPLGGRSHIAPESRLDLEAGVRRPAGGRDLRSDFPPGRAAAADQLQVEGFIERSKDRPHPLNVAA